MNSSGARPSDQALASGQAPARCVLCDHADFLQESHGVGGLNDVCQPCFHIWYDGCPPRVDPVSGRYRVFGEDIRAISLKARAEGSWPFNGIMFRLRDSAGPKGIARTIPKGPS